MQLKGEENSLVQFVEHCFVGVLVVWVRLRFFWSCMHEQSQKSGGRRKQAEGLATWTSQGVCINAFVYASLTSENRAYHCVVFR